MCCRPWGHKESDTTWGLNNNNFPMAESWGGGLVPEAALTEIPLSQSGDQKPKIKVVTGTHYSEASRRESIPCLFQLSLAAGITWWSWLMATPLQFLPLSSITYSPLTLIRTHMGLRAHPATPEWPHLKDLKSLFHIRRHSHHICMTNSEMEKPF